MSGRAYVKMNIISPAGGIMDDFGNVKPYILDLSGENASLSETERIQLHIVKIARQFIHHNFSSKISVAEIANKVFVSQYHFSRIFKKHTRYSPYQYLLHIRLRHARRLMLQKELSIKEITFQSGFSSIDHFSAAFAKKHTICPSDYRKKLFWPGKKDQK